MTAEERRAKCSDDMNDKILRGLAQEELMGLVSRAYLALKWCDEHEGECLGDHPGVMRHFRQLLADIGEVTP